MTAAKHTPGPWHTCGSGRCNCFTVMCNDHPIAQVTSGEWGDRYPAIRSIGTSTEAKYEAYMEQVTYGAVNKNTARANWRLIAAAPDLLTVCEAISKAKFDTQTLVNADVLKAIQKAAQRAVSKATKPKGPQ